VRGRYWARTSEPQLVETAPSFTPARGGSHFSLPYRDFALQRQDAFAPVCTLSRGLVVARGSTVGGSPTATANNDEHHGKRQYSRLAGGARPRRGARASSGMRSPQARAHSRSRLPSSRATRTLLCPTLGLCCTCLPRSSRGHVVCFSGRAVAQVTFPHHWPTRRLSLIRRNGTATCRRFRISRQEGERAAHYRTARLPRESRLIALPNQAAHCPRHRPSGAPCPSASLTGSRRC
jgi:hypothetical protein